MNRFKELRVKNGYKTQQDLAAVLFVNQTAVSQWERGVTIPSPPILLKLSELYGVSTDYLLGRTDEKSPAPQEPSASLAYSPLEQEIIKAYRAAPPVLQEAVLNVLHIPIPASNVRQKKNA